MTAHGRNGACRTGRRSRPVRPDLNPAVTASRRASVARCRQNGLGCCCCRVSAASRASRARRAAIRRRSRARSQCPLLDGAAVRLRLPMVDAVSSTMTAGPPSVAILVAATLPSSAGTSGAGLPGRAASAGGADVSAIAAISTSARHGRPRSPTGAARRLRAGFGRRGSARLRRALPGAQRRQLLGLTGASASAAVSAGAAISGAGSGTAAARTCVPRLLGHG